MTFDFTFSLQPTSDGLQPKAEREALESVIHLKCVVKQC